MRVLIACEFSQAVCEEMILAGCDAMSCDILPAEKHYPHHQGDVRDVLYDDWDLIIAHPPCTRLANSGVRWLNERNLWDEMYQACDFFNLFTERAKSGVKMCIENPIPHRYAVDRIGKYNQIIQPWQFGHGETKATCLWLYNLPELRPTDIVEGREQRIWKMSPGENRSKERSKTFQGIALAMAQQWTK
jgi:hypothetical protein